MAFKETFKVMAHPKQEGKYVIIHANHLASERLFDSYEEAENEIEKGSWDLTASLICSVTEAILINHGIIPNQNGEFHKTNKRIDNSTEASSNNKEDKK